VDDNNINEKNYSQEKANVIEGEPYRNKKKKSFGDFSSAVTKNKGFWKMKYCFTGITDFTRLFWTRIWKLNCFNASFLELKNTIIEIYRFCNVFFFIILVVSDNMKLPPT